MLEGKVVNATTKEPIRKAHVILEFSEEPHEAALVATTDEVGRFLFADTKAGRYKLTAEKAGFLDGVYGGTKPEDEGILLKVAGGDRLRNLTLRLFPGGVISGQVLDADGDPLPGNGVILWTRHPGRRAASDSPVGETTTNRAGEYRFDGLLPRVYYVGASAGAWGYATKQVPVDSSGKTTKLHDLTTFYPGALSLRDAQGVRVEGGADGHQYSNSTRPDIECKRTDCHNNWFAGEIRPQCRS